MVRYKTCTAYFQVDDVKECMLTLERRVHEFGGIQISQPIDISPQGIQDDCPVFQASYLIGDVGVYQNGVGNPNDENGTIFIKLASQCSDKDYNSRGPIEEVVDKLRKLYPQISHVTVVHID